MVHANLRMLIPPRERGDVVDFLVSFARRTRFEPGCIGCRVYRDLEQKKGILLEELWKDEEHLERHLRTSGFQKVLLVLELSPAAPEISFEAVTRSTGIETIEEARCGTKAEGGLESRPPS